MANVAVQLLGFFLAVLGLSGTLVALVLPHWRHTAYFTSNLITATSYMKGLWMECVSHTTGIYQCEVHRSMLSLPLDLQAARALMVLSAAISIMATVISVFGMTCTRCLQHSPAKVPIAVSGGVCFISAGILCLITASWTASDVIRDAYDPFSTSGMKYQVGLCVYIGFASAIFSIFGGGVLSAACWDKADSPNYKCPVLNPVHLPPDLHGHTACECYHSAEPKSSSSIRDKPNNDMSSSSIRDKPNNDMSSSSIRDKPNNDMSSSSIEARPHNDMSSSSIEDRPSNDV
ncbi:claudin-14-like [Brachyhypopomus gauderio]|uniref:claudin-14-like n=1 Tax=Brachyhypopomus gauderio TaxID=698409 RepID=UPI0040413727